MKMLFIFCLTLLLFFSLNVRPDWNQTTYSPCDPSYSQGSVDSWDLGVNDSIPETEVIINPY